MNAIVRVDGGAKPGRATAGAVLSTLEGVTIAHDGRVVGAVTNNVAEHTACVMGLELAIASGVDDLLLLSDSELVLGQAFGDYRAYGELRELADRSRDLARSFTTFRRRHVPRELNAAADAVCHAVEDGWWLPPGASKPDGTADLAYVVALEIPLADARDLERRRALKRLVTGVVENVVPVAASRNVCRTNAEVHVDERSAHGILTFAVRVGVLSGIASSPERRRDLEERLRVAIARMPGTARTRVARISG